MTKVIPLQANDPFVGDWIPADMYCDIVISIAKKDDEYQVSVIDTDDEEEAEIYELKYDGNSLSFNVHWASNGRFVKYALVLVADKVVRLIYTYSGQETWVKRED